MNRQIPEDKINLRLILVCGKTCDFLFPQVCTAADVAQYVFDHWPAEWEEERVQSASLLKLIYHGRFLHGNVLLGGFDFLVDMGMCAERVFAAAWAVRNSSEYCINLVGRISAGFKMYPSFPRLPPKKVTIPFWRKKNGSDEPTGVISFCTAHNCAPESVCFKERLDALSLPLGKTTVMHLVARKSLPEPNSHDNLKKTKSRLCCNCCSVM